jgi:CHAD domain-containing protein
MSDIQISPDGKWIDGLTADMPVGKAARRAVAARLAAVRDAVGETTAWGPDPEPIHRLRVATRRAGAAVDVFADVLPGKDYRKVRKMLKKLRRAAGVARDADVFLDAVRTWSVHQSPAARPGLNLLLGHALARRQAAQEKLASTVNGAFGDMERVLDDGGRKRRRGRKETLGEMAKPTVAGLISDFADTADRNFDDIDEMHRVRVAAKRLRYALELFIDCFRPTVRERVYPLVEGVQDILGVANDCQQATRQIDGLLDIVRRTQPGLWDTVRGGIEDYRTHVGQKLREQRWAFVDWWRRWRAVDAEALIDDFIAPASSAGAAESPGQATGVT